MPAKTRPSKLQNDPYLELILSVHPLMPIRTSAQHKEAKAALRSLAADRRPVVADFKKVLAAIIENYERESDLQVDTTGVTAAQIVRHLLQERNISVNAFAKSRGISQSALSDMLNGRRDWSKSVIVNVADFFGLNRGLFLQ